MSKKNSVAETLAAAQPAPDRPRPGQPAPAPVMQQGQAVVNPATVTSVRQQAALAKK